MLSRLKKRVELRKSEKKSVKFNSSPSASSTTATGKETQRTVSSSDKTKDGSLSKRHSCPAPSQGEISGSLRGRFQVQSVIEVIPGDGVDGRNDIFYGENFLLQGILSNPINSIEEFATERNLTTK
ncbi:hypothetical protein SK128_013017 [Halocaridina rubra]|uniref:Uncharacterized protein n=1 Tax=Halocaridina rubra TaxID=373956 RepID=A0AAN8X3Q9_HALRR